MGIITTNIITKALSLLAQMEFISKRVININANINVAGNVMVEPIAGTITATEDIATSLCSFLLYVVAQAPLSAVAS